MESDPFGTGRRSARLGRAYLCRPRPRVRPIPERTCASLEGDRSLPSPRLPDSKRRTGRKDKTVPRRILLHRHLHAASSQRVSRGQACLELCAHRREPNSLGAAGSCLRVGSSSRSPRGAPLIWRLLLSQPQCDRRELVVGPRQGGDSRRMSTIIMAMVSSRSSMSGTMSSRCRCTEIRPSPIPIFGV